MSLEIRRPPLVCSLEWVSHPTSSFAQVLRAETPTFSLTDWPGVGRRHVGRRQAVCATARQGPHGARCWDRGAEAPEALQLEPLLFSPNNVAGILTVDERQVSFGGSRCGRGCVS